MSLFPSQISASRRTSPFKFTKATSQRNQCYSPSRRCHQEKLHTNKYHCHYPNGAYMGGIDCYKRHGQGILLMDSGACVLSRYSYDTMVGLNVIFRDKSMTVLFVGPNKSKQVCYRLSFYLLIVSFNCRGVVEETGYFVDFKNRRLYKITLYQSEIVKKQVIKDGRVNDQIFNHKDYSQLIADQKVSQALKFNFSLGEGIKYINKGQEISIGFGQKGDKFFSGLAFKLQINLNPQEFDVMLKERGCFEGQKMHIFGQKHYSNGNYYIGGFSQGFFEGRGMLVDPQQNKWTYGIYKRGELVHILQSSATGKSKRIDILRKVHENLQPYIQTSIKFSPTLQQLTLIATNALNSKVCSTTIEDKYTSQKKRIDNLRVIRDDFLLRKYEDHTERMIKQELSKPKRVVPKRLTEEALSTLSLLDELQKDINDKKSQIQVHDNEHQTLQGTEYKNQTEAPIIYKKQFQKTQILEADNKNKWHAGLKQISTCVEEICQDFKNEYHTSPNSYRTKIQSNSIRNSNWNPGLFLSPSVPSHESVCDEKISGRKQIEENPLSYSQPYSSLNGFYEQSFTPKSYQSSAVVSNQSVKSPLAQYTDEECVSTQNVIVTSLSSHQAVLQKQNQ